ncbi:hypothetical protein BM536_037655 [Streptomyces phaeoluteigriseus]|uniref:Uncharacterized protein n=1 Tax=Streptomyces phaeoluteigriseus TaxID=114686 RepID=A0A1V6MHA2_9ACTN|nr:hypothetical protein [Streptomyces phaeoluteigriseus]OQD51844.1 hypothetical protein BM536_037655 [Streptomyces phaeoluteigriseus]
MFRLHHPPDDFASRQITPAAGFGAEPLPPVSVHPHMVFGSGLTDPLDTLALLHCLFLAASGRPFSVADVLASLRAEGVTAANDRSGLVGRDAVRGSFRRLEAAGFIRRHQSNEKGSFGKVAYELYQHPIYNPDWSAQNGPATAFPQVTPGTSMPSAVRPAETSKTAGHTADGIDGDGIAGPGNAVAGQLDKTAGHTGDGIAGPGFVAPPNPPRREEEDSSSPNPSAATAGASGIDPSRLAAASELLAGLPGRWACGRKTVRELSPLLAETAAAQGWKLDRALATHLTRRTRKEPMGVLRERIEDLPRFSSVRAVSAASPRQEPLPVAADPAPAVASSPAPSAVDPSAVAQALELLLSLTEPWTLSPESAQRLAPVLAAKALERGWAFDGELREKLMQNPGGAHNHELLLETHRIGRLPYRKKAPARPSRPGALPQQAAIDACPRCDAWGQYEVDGRFALCRHEPLPDVAGVPAQGSAPDGPETRPDSVGAVVSSRNLTDLLDALRQPAL